VHFATFVTHPIQVCERNGDRLRADAKEAAYVDDYAIYAVDMIDRADFVVVRTVNRCPFEVFSGEFGGGETDVVGVVHNDLLGPLRTNNRIQRRLFPDGPINP
jgi:hypothetical protein